jgi:hypothetical protein
LEIVAFVHLFTFILNILERRKKNEWRDLSELRLAEGEEEEIKNGIFVNRERE